MTYELVERGTELGSIWMEDVDEHVLGEYVLRLGTQDWNVEEDGLVLLFVDDASLEQWLLEDLFDGQVKNEQSK